MIPCLNCIVLPICKEKLKVRKDITYKFVESCSLLQEFLEYSGIEYRYNLEKLNVVYNFFSKEIRRS